MEYNLIKIITRIRAQAAKDQYIKEKNPGERQERVNTKKRNHMLGEGLEEKKKKTYGISKLLFRIISKRRTKMIGAQLFHVCGL